MPANEALLLVDVVANLDHPDGAELEQAIRHAQPNLVRAEAHARRHGIPIIFANDALDDWTGDRDATNHAQAEPILGPTRPTATAQR